MSSDVSRFGLAQINPLRYRGYYYEQETGLYYLQTRYYDPKVRRFLNADDASVLTKDPEQLTEKNLYAYCDDNPVMYRDDAGMFVITATAIEIAVGAIINIATSYIAAKATGQKFGIGDCVVAAIAGAVSVIIPRSFTAMVASAFFTGMGTTVLSCMAGDGLKTAISKGAIAGACMYMSINTYMAIRIPITKEMPSLATTVFGAGSNIMAATGIAVYSSKRTNGKKYQKTNNNQKKYKKTSAKKYLSNNKSKSWKYFVFKMNQLRY